MSKCEQMNKKEKETKPKNKQLFSIDELDKNILRILATDSRLSFRKISAFLNVSTATVAERIKRLEKEGIIQKYTVKLNHEKLGYELSAVIEVTVSKGKLREIEEKIAKMKNVCAVYDVTGLTDVFVVAKFKNREELNAFVKGLLALPYVERTNTHFVLNIVKEDFDLV